MEPIAYRAANRCLEGRKAYSYFAANLAPSSDFLFLLRPTCWSDTANHMAGRINSLDHTVDNCAATTNCLVRGCGVGGKACESGLLSLWDDVDCNMAGQCEGKSGYNYKVWSLHTSLFHSDPRHHITVSTTSRLPWTSTRRHVFQLNLDCCFNSIWLHFTDNFKPKLGNSI